MFAYIYCIILVFWRLTKNISEFEPSLSKILSPKIINGGIFKVLLHYLPLTVKLDFQPSAHSLVAQSSCPLSPECQLSLLNFPGPTKSHLSSINP